MRHKSLIPHEAIVTMPAMTGLFRAQPPAILNGLKVSDKIKFQEGNGRFGYVVTRVEKSGN